MFKQTLKLSKKKNKVFGQFVDIDEITNQRITLFYKVKCLFCERTSNAAPAEKRTLYQSCICKPSTEDSCHYPV